MTFAALSHICFAGRGLCNHPARRRVGVHHRRHLVHVPHGAHLGVPQSWLLEGPWPENQCVLIDCSRVLIDWDLVDVCSVLLSLAAGVFSRGGSSGSGSKGAYVGGRSDFVGGAVTSTPYSDI